MLRKGLMDILANYRGGLIGIAIYLIFTALIWFIAFMTAFGNPSPTADAILAAVEIYAQVANPLWMIPVSYGIGAWLLKKEDE